MKKYAQIIISIILLILIALVFIKDKRSEITEVCFDKKCYNIETANTPIEREKGLMFRESLDKNSGMLFKFDDSDPHYFWMKNTLINLDLIGINEDLIIQDLKENLKPCSMSSCPSFEIKGSRYVLEVNAGVIKDQELYLGQKVTLK